jgi:hypothetical protein
MNSFFFYELTWIFLHYGRELILLCPVPTKLIVGGKDVGFLVFGTKDCVNGEISRELLPSLEVGFIDELGRRKLN